MRRIIIMCLLIFALISITAAEGIQYGVKTGLTLNSLAWDPDIDEALEDDVDAKILLGTSQGIFLIYPLSDTLSLQADLLYIKKGHQAESDSFSFDATYKIVTDYVELPLLIKYSVKDNIRIIAGPAIALKVKSEFMLQGETPEGDFAEGQFADDEMKNTDFSAVLGAQYLFGNNFLGDIRYEMGLTNIVDTPEGEGGPDSIKTRAFTFSIGYIF